MKAIQQISKGVICMSTYLLLAYLAGPLVADANERVPLYRDIERLRSQKFATTQQMVGVRQELNELSEKISELKGRQDANYNPFTDYRLKSLLQAAQDTASTLNQLETKRQQESRHIASLQQRLHDLIEIEIDALAAKAKVAQSTNQQHLIKSEIQALILERQKLKHDYGFDDSYLADDTDGFSKDEPSNVDDTLEELKVRSVQLHDREDRIYKKLSSVEKQLNKLKRRKLIYKEMNVLFDEELFFAETSFSKIVGNRQDTQPLNIDTTTKSGDGDKSDNQDTTLDENGNPIVSDQADVNQADESAATNSNGESLEDVSSSAVDADSNLDDSLPSANDNLANIDVASEEQLRRNSGFERTNQNSESLSIDAQLRLLSDLQIELTVKLAAIKDEQERIGQRLQEDLGR